MNANTQISKITTVEQAIDLLHQCHDISGIGNALEYLGQKSLRYHLLSLYSHYFPQKYDRSSAFTYPNLEQNDEWLKYTEREIEFLQLVNVGSFIDWLESDLTTNFQYIVKIWNQCTTRR